MAGEETTNQGNITNEYNAAQTGLNMDNVIAQIPKGKLTYALNAAVENFDSNSVNYQNEPGNQPCGNALFPNNFVVIGNHFIPEKNKHIFFLVNTVSGASEIGYMQNNDCIYHTILSDTCLAFNINNPIHKVVHRITNCTTEIYWTDGLNPRRYLNIDSVPTTDICNKIKVQPNFNIPQLDIVSIDNGGDVTAGTYQFAIQYCDALGYGYTSYYSVTNPTSIADPNITSPNYDYPVNKSITLHISNLELNGYYTYYNLAVIKTVNNISSVELVGTYFIEGAETDITYTGQNQTAIKLSLNDIYEKFPFYDVAQDVTSVQDILVWDQLSANDRINYQSIAAQISLQWQTYKVPAGNSYANSLLSNKLRGYLRDEVYAFEIVFLLKNGKQTDGFHIPGRVSNAADLVPISNTNPDYIGTGTSAPTWQIYNTGADLGPGSGPSIAGTTPYRYGSFSYWQSTESYPSNIVFTSAGLTGPIRHHKFPDVLVSPIFESASYVNGKPVMQTTGDAFYPIGVKLNTNQVWNLINASSLTQAQKDNIAGFKIVRGNRNTNKSIIGKGILRNIGKYTRDNTEYYYPNYPYNDIKADPFLLSQSNAYNSQSILYSITTVTSPGSVSITDCNTNTIVNKPIVAGQTYSFCSLTRPVLNGGAVAAISGQGTITVGITTDSLTTFKYFDSSGTEQQIIVSVTDGLKYLAISSSAGPITYFLGSKNYTITVSDTVNPLTLPGNLEGFSTNDSKFRMVLNSPDTSFQQPSLGSILKLENALIGAGKSHFVKVKDNAKYKFINKSAQKLALSSSYNLADSTGTFDANAMFTVYQSYLTIYINGLTRQNFAYSFNSIASYDYWASVTNSGNKQRQLSLSQYLIPGVQSVGDDHDINNFQRESSIYLKTSGSTPLPFVKDVPAVSSLGITDNSRFTLSSIGNCGNPEQLSDITTVMYYGSLKNIINNQWGQMYSYETIDTGFQVDFDYSPGVTTFFGGDTFISRFAFKTKLPFFIDNRVAAPDDSDIFYDEIGNVAYPKYWHSSRSILSNYWADTTEMKNIISVKATSFDCPNDPFYYNPSTTTTTTTQAPGSVTPSTNDYGYAGKFYMFAYGIPYFYCETSINTDLRQAINNKEGDFYPHVSSGIPDSWLQQTFVPITLDNTYYYNPSFSKQNVENSFTHLPFNWNNDQCNTAFPFRAIYSDPQVSDATSKVNNWLIYRPVSYFDFPQSYGNLTSLDGIQNKAILARFENKSLLYNTMLTIDTSNPQAAYLGNSTLFRSSPPIDFAETDLGYVGSQHKFLLKIPQGQVTIDAKRKQIFLVGGNSAEDITAFGSGVNRFMMDHLSFEILQYYPTVNVDNHYLGLGLHGVYDSRYNRIIITKLDYIPQSAYIGVIKYGSSPFNPVTYRKFYIGTDANPTIVNLSNTTYFCNKSWTLSFNLNTKSWISFHSYLPNYYIGENAFFYSGLNSGCNMSIVADIPTSASCVLPGGTATRVVPTTTTTSSTTTAPPIYNCNLPSGSAIANTTTTTTSTTAAPTTTTTSTTIGGVTGVTLKGNTPGTALTNPLDACNLITSQTLYFNNAYTFGNPVATVYSDPTLTTLYNPTGATAYVVYTDNLIYGIAPYTSKFTGSTYGVCATTTTTTSTTSTSTTSTTSTSTSTTTSTSTSTTSTTTTAAPTTTTTSTTVACVPLVYQTDWSISGNRNPAPNTSENYTFTGITTNLSDYPITVSVQCQGGVMLAPIIFNLNSPGDTHILNVYWTDPCNSLGANGYLRAAVFNTCTDTRYNPSYFYLTACGTTTTTTSSSSTSTTSSTTTSAPAPPTTTSTTSTTTTRVATVYLSPQNSLDGASYTPYINGIADPSWDSGSRTYPLGTTIRLDYASPACSVTLNGTPFTSGDTLTLSTTSNQTFVLYNANHWVNDGGTVCSGSELRQPIINDCGATSYNVISSCSCSCDVTCNGTYFGGNYCDGNALKRAQYYYCNNQPTGYVETISSCSCSCNQACSGTYWSETCSGTTLNRVEKYTCNNANTGNTQTITCSSSCGASTTPVWVNSGSPYCITGSCTLRQDQVQTNPCAAGTTRTIDTGTASSSCGTNYWEYYCVNYGVAPYERRRRQVNTCTGNTGVDELVGYDSVDCGYYSPLPSFGISASTGSSGVACTRTIGNTAYCTGGDPYIGNTIHTTDNPSSSVFASGFYHINVSGDEYIQINGSGVVVDRGSC